MNTENLLKQILHPNNLNQAYLQVKRNKGAAGVDGMTINELGHYLKENGEEIKDQIRTRSYQPKPVKRIEIPKADGGVRNLGVPTVVDRFIQQAMAQVLTPIYEEKDHENSYGFRPWRCAEMAIIKSLEFMIDGYTWIVDIDLEKFFDKVNHDILIDRLSRRIEDKRVLDLIRKYLKSGIMLNGVVVSNEEGTPQGGPLSPLLSNIMLDEVDKKLERRGHKYIQTQEKAIGEFPIAQFFQKHLQINT